MGAQVVAEMFVLFIDWTSPGLPGLVGPFTSREAAWDWSARHVDNGVCHVSPLAGPEVHP